MWLLLVGCDEVVECTIHILVSHQDVLQTRREFGLEVGLFEDSSFGVDQYVIEEVNLAFFCGIGLNSVDDAAVNERPRR